MPASKEDKEFVAYLIELMQDFGVVTSRAMFGGFGLYHDGLMFALVADSELYLKVDELSKAKFLEKGMPAFSYSKNAKTYQMSYFLVPEEALEDNDEMTYWARQGYEAALRCKK